MVEWLDKVNAELKRQGSRVVIEIRGQKLVLRGTLPPKATGKWRQQRIPTSLPAIEDSKRVAKTMALEVTAKIQSGTFNWNDFRHHQNCSRSLQDYINNFKQDLYAGRLEGLFRCASPKSETTWEKTYAPYLNRLLALPNAEIENLPDLCCKCLEAMSIGSRSRQIATVAYRRFLIYMGMNFNLPWPGQSTPLKSRDLPSRKMIVKMWAKIPNRAWQNVFALMATYGLRNHEVFKADLSRIAVDKTVVVRPDTKTGERIALPYPETWLDAFDLNGEIDLPSISINASNQRIGQQVSLQFRRYNLECNPYDLRHAYAIRLLEERVPDVLAAKMLGHSIVSLNEIYRRWMPQDQSLNLVQQYLQPAEDAASNAQVMQLDLFAPV